MHSSDIVCPYCGQHPSPMDPEEKKWWNTGIAYNGLQLSCCSFCVNQLYKTHSKQTAANPEAEVKKEKGKQEITAFNPRDVFDHLNKDIIGQEDAKRTISVAIYQHFMRINNPNLVQKSNVLIVGPSGSGKTELARSIANFLNLPFVQVDTTTITPRGYVGESPEMIIEKLYSAANGSIEDTEKGIVFLDEFDKTPSGVATASYKAKAVQQELLKIIEGAKIEIKIGMEPHAQKVVIDTSNILFIAAGSFVGLEEMVSKKADNVIGIGSGTLSEKTIAPKELAQLVENKHFEEFGIIPEILGRFPVVCFTQALSKADLVKILTEPQNSIVNQYEELFKVAGSNLVIDKNLLDIFAENAIKEKIGARGLKKQIERRLKPILFDIDKYKGLTVTVCEDVVLQAPLAKSSLPEGNSTGA